MYNYLYCEVIHHICVLQIPGLFACRRHPPHSFTPIITSNHFTRLCCTLVYMQGSTNVTFTALNAPSSCTAEQTSLTLTVRVGCPTSKAFTLVYPVSWQTCVQVAMSTVLATYCVLFTSTYQDGSWNASQHAYWLPVSTHVSVERSYVRMYRMRPT